MPATEHSIVSEPMPAPTMDILRSNPLIQQIVEESLAVLEAKMKLEIQGGMHQFVIGFAEKVMDTQHAPTMKNMLLELVETVKLAEKISWPIARGAFTASMLKIEDESISWNDTHVLADHCLTYSQSAVSAGSTTMSPCPSSATPGNGSIKKICMQVVQRGDLPTFC